MNDSITNNDAISLIAAILSGPSNFNMNTILDNSLHDVGGYINVISEEGSKKLKEVGFSETECINSKCPIFHIDFDQLIKYTESLSFNTIQLLASVSYCIIVSHNQPLIPQSM